MARKTFTIERAGNEEQGFTEVFELLLELHREGGYAPMDVEKTADTAYLVLAEGMTFVARSEDGDLIGTLGLSEVAFWYSSTTFLLDKWFYVRAAYRKGRVGMALMRAAREEADRRNKIVCITVTNPDRRRKHTAMSLESQLAGYVPLGYTLKLR